MSFDQAAEDYAKYRAGFPPELFARLRRFGVGRRRQAILDVGTGTGTLAHGFAQQGCHVIAVDIAPGMLHYAREQDPSGDRVKYFRASAEDIPLLPEQFDVITAGQCWHWFDRPIVAAEVHRLLRPGGKLVIAHFDWLAPAEGVVEATLELIQEYNPLWNPQAFLLDNYGMYPAWLGDVADAGFTNIETFSFDVDVEYTPEAWRGRVRASAGVTTMAEGMAAQFDSALANALWQRFPMNPLSIPHRVWTLICEK